MKSLKTIKEIIKKNKRLLEENYKVKVLGIFGSYSHRDSRKGSDIDIIVEFSKTPDFFNKTQVYYNTIKTDTDIQSKMALLKITPEVADNRLLQRESVIAKYAEYVKENGQSQTATFTKNQAMIELKEWMEDFDIIAKVALYDRPQLLESLGIFVRS